MKELRNIIKSLTREEWVHLSLVFVRKIREAVKIAFAFMLIFWLCLSFFRNIGMVINMARLDAILMSLEAALLFLYVVEDLLWKLDPDFKSLNHDL